MGYKTVDITQKVIQAMENGFKKYTKQALWEIQQTFLMAINMVYIKGVAYGTGIYILGRR